VAINSAPELRRKLRKAKLSAAQVVEGADVPRERLRRFIRGQEAPTLRELDRIEQLILDQRERDIARLAEAKVGT